MRPRAYAATDRGERPQVILGRRGRVGRGAEKKKIAVRGVFPLFVCATPAGEARSCENGNNFFGVKARFVLG